MVNKKIVTILLTIALLSSSYVFIPSEALANTHQDKAEIMTLTGKASISVTPDIAFVNVGVVESNKSLEVAQSLNKEKSNKIIEELKKLNIEDKDILTKTYSVSPTYNWENNKQILIGYNVSSIIEVKIKDISKTGNLLDKVIAVGGNRVNGIRFASSRESELYHEALAKAALNAKEKANSIATVLGLKLGKPKSIIEQSTYYAPFIDIQAKNLNSDASSTPINPGELNINATVLIEFAY